MSSARGRSRETSTSLKKKRKRSTNGDTRTSSSSKGKSKSKSKSKSKGTKVSKTRLMAPGVPKRARGEGGKKVNHRRMSTEEAEEMKLEVVAY